MITGFYAHSEVKAQTKKQVERVGKNIFPPVELKAAVFR